MARLTVSSIKGSSSTTSSCPRPPISRYVDRSPHLCANEFREIERVLFGHGNRRKDLENAPQIANADALLDQTSNDVREQDERNGLRDDVPYGRGGELLELVEQSLNFRQAEKVGGTRSQELPRCRSLQPGQPRSASASSGSASAAAGTSKKRTTTWRSSRSARTFTRGTGKGNAELEEELLAENTAGGSESQRVGVHERRQVLADLDAPRHDERSTNVGSSLRR